MFRRRLCDFSWGLKRLPYFSAWPIGIDRCMSFLHLHPLYGLLSLLQLTHRRLLELPIRNHGIVRHGPDLVLDWMDTFIILRWRRYLPSWLCPSLSKLRPNSDAPAPQVCVRQGSRPRFFTTIYLSFLTILLDLASLSYFADVFANAFGN